VVAATALLNGFELYDFTVFGLFAATIGDQFFPSADAMTSLLLAVATFGVGFLARPLGAIVFGSYADRFGRRAALLLTCWMAAFATLALVVCPSYASIGVAAPLIAVAARVLQGLAVGGEWGPAGALVMEVAPASRRGLVVGWLLVGHGSAPLAGALIGTWLSHMLAPAQLAAWGWRAAFAAGLPLFAVGYYVRRRLLGGEVQQQARTMHRPLRELFRHHSKTLTVATLLMGFRTAPLYAVVFYMPTYVERVLHRHVTTGFLASALATSLLVVLAPPSGWLIDRLPRRKPLVLATASIAGVAVLPIVFLMTQAPTTIVLMGGVFCIAVLLPLGSCAATVLTLEALPSTVRATGQGMAYALGTALFGGTAQVIVTALIKWTGNPMSVAWYVAACCLLSVGALLPFKEERTRA